MATYTFEENTDTVIFNGKSFYREIRIDPNSVFSSEDKRRYPDFFNDARALVSFFEIKKWPGYVNGIIGFDVEECSDFNHQSVATSGKTLYQIKSVFDRRGL